MAAQGAGARAGDGADVRDHLLAGHADAGVGDLDELLVLVDRQLDRGLLGVDGVAQLGPGEGEEAQGVDGVGGVGDQLAEEDLFFRVEGVDHKVQQLLHLGTEGALFLLRRISLGSGTCGSRGRNGFGLVSHAAGT